MACLGFMLCASPLHKGDYKALHVESCCGIMHENHTQSVIVIDVVHASGESREIGKGYAAFPHGNLSCIFPGLIEQEPPLNSKAKPA